MYIKRNDAERMLCELTKQNDNSLYFIIKELEGAIAEDDARIEARKQEHERKMHELRMTIYEKLLCFPFGATCTELQYALMDELDKPSMCKISGNLRQMFQHPEQYPGITWDCSSGKSIYSVKVEA